MRPDRSFKHLFGPVPSRRLGRSLGIDLVPFKTCTFDCIYCQLGRTIKKTTARREYVPIRKIIEDLAGYLKDPGCAIDYVTLSGSGEPTLHSGLGRIIASIKKMTDIPVAVLTNGSLLYDREVRQELALADVVLPTLAADSETVFQCVHRPASSITFDRFIDGLTLFSAGFRNELWLELFLLQGITAMKKNVCAMNLILEQIKPAKIQINTATRPPCEGFAYPVSKQRLAALVKLLSGTAEIVAEKRRDETEPFSNATEADIMELIRRRPCTVEDVSRGLSIHTAEASKILAHLIDQGTATAHRRDNRTYFRVTGTD